MKKVLIAAVDANNVLADSKRPGVSLWGHLHEDLKHFVRQTKGKPCIMGRTTADSLAKLLGPDLLDKGRTNIVLTKHFNSSRYSANVLCVRTMKSALRHAENHLRIRDIARDKGEANDGTEVMIIGGGEIYEQSFGSADKIILTVVHGTYEGDIKFPFISEDEWVLMGESPEFSGNHYPNFHINTYERIKRIA